jgi:DNA-binding MarR family transcriptional regulator
VRPTDANGIGALPGALAPILAPPADAGRIDRPEPSTAAPAGLRSAGAGAAALAYSRGPSQEPNGAWAARPMPTPAKPAAIEQIERSLGETPQGHLQELELRNLLGYQVAQASIVTLQVFDDVVAKAEGLRTVEYTVLALIRANRAVSPAQLAKALNLSPSYITAALDKLDGRGLVRRETNESDRRGQRLHVTAAGEALAKRLTDELLRAERETLNTLTGVERLMLAELLHKLGRSRRRAGPAAR